MELADAHELVLTLRFATGGGVRPAEILKTVFGFSDAEVRQCRILKTVTKDSAHV